MLLISLLARSAGPMPVSGLGWPYLRPEFERLMDAVSFHVGFDSEEMEPDIAAGPMYMPPVFRPHGSDGGGVRFQPGPVGAPLVPGSGAAGSVAGGHESLCIQVTDPLSAELACVKGFAQRRYEALALVPVTPLPMARRCSAAPFSHE